MISEIRPKFLSRKKRQTVQRVILNKVRIVYIAHTTSELSYAFSAIRRIAVDKSTAYSVGYMTATALKAEINGHHVEQTFAGSCRPMVARVGS